MDNPFAQQQKILLYVFPLIFAVSGVSPAGGITTFTRVQSKFQSRSGYWAC